MGFSRFLTRRSLLLLAAALALPLTAQEGFPLKGSWIGVWEGNTQAGNDVLLIMNWDGKNVTGVINPGTDDIQIEKATLDPNGWKVHIEAKGYVIDGEIKELELPKRYITGTWTRQGAKGKFEVRRQ